MLYGPSHDPSVLFPLSCANRHTSSRFLNPHHGGRIDFEISCPDPLIRQNVFSSEAVHPGQLLGLGFEIVEVRMR